MTYSTALKKLPPLLAAFVALLSLAGFLSVPVWAAELEETKLVAPDGDVSYREEYHSFGRSVSVSGSYAVAGSFANSAANDSSGCACVFKRKGGEWVEQAQLFVEGDSEVHLGTYSISGSFIVAGGWDRALDGTQSDCAYVFKGTGSTWSAQARLAPPEGTFGGFGFSVATNGSFAVVGAPFYRNGDISSGCAYVFKRTGTTWDLEETLLPLDGATGDCFGWSVDISGNYIAVGSRYDDDLGHNSGSVYLFKQQKNSWVLQDKLVADDGNTGDSFGASIAVSGNHVVVGAPYEDAKGRLSGAAYVFTQQGGTWFQQTKLIASDGASHDKFGNSVSLWGSRVMVGSPLHDAYGSNAGGAYVFKQKGDMWSQSQKLLGSDTTQYDNFGSSISLSGIYAMVGSPGDDDKGFDSGSVHLYDLDPGDRPVLTVSPLYMDVPAKGANVAAKISNSGAGTLTWQAETNDEWLNINGKASGTGSKTLTIKVDKNDGTRRVGTMTVYAQDAIESPAVVMITQEGSNEPPDNSVPVALDDAYEIMQGQSLFVPCPGVLSNDTDEDGDALTAVFAGGVSFGTLVFDPDGSFTYTSGYDFKGTDYFDYKASDGVIESETARVNITVKEAMPDFYTITAEAGSGGSITPEGEVEVKRGASRIFSITADVGYHIQDVVVDGTSAGVLSSYTFENVTDDHFITVVFDMNSIQESIDAALAAGGGTVWVKEGTYFENIILYDSICLVSSGDPSRTIIDGSGNGDVVTMSSVTNGGIIGFTIQNSAQDDDFAAIRCTGQGSPFIGQCIVRHNNHGVITEENISPFIANNIITENTGNGIISSGPALLYSNIIVENKGAGIMCTGQESIKSRYNNAWYNETGYINCSPGKGDISLDPMFAGPDADDYHLSVDSPCIDAGHPDIEDEDGTRSDMGVYGGGEMGCEQELFTITANAGIGGCIMPKGDVEVKWGSDQSFLIMPEPGYQIQDVVIDGMSMGVLPFYTFEDITRDHSVEVIFEADL